MLNKSSLILNHLLIKKIHKLKLKIICGKLQKDKVEDFKVKLKNSIKLLLKMKKDLTIFKLEFLELIKKSNKLN